MLEQVIKTGAHYYRLLIKMSILLAYFRGKIVKLLT